MAKVIPKTLPDDSRILPNHPDTHSRNPENPFRGSGNGNGFREMTASEEKMVRDWLRRIEEFDAPTISDVINRCRNDLTAKAYFIKRAQES